MAFYRSMLFVPGQKLDWMLRATRFGADALIFDLEDAVPIPQKREARDLVGQAIDALADAGPGLFVRVNGWRTGLLLEDVRAITRAGLDGVLLAKTERPKDVQALDLVLGDLEAQRGVAVGTIEIIPIMETAIALNSVYELCTSSPRVRRITGVGALAPGGDTHRVLGYRHTDSELETLYIASKKVLEARAAGIENLLTGVSTEVADLDLVRRRAERSRQLGANGGLIIHPSHVPVVHDVFSPTADEIAEARGLLEAMQAAIARGESATRYAGRMVDYAHVRSSTELLERAQRNGIDVGEYPRIEVLT